MTVDWLVLFESRVLNIDVFDARVGQYFLSSSAGLGGEEGGGTAPARTTQPVNRSDCDFATCFHSSGRFSFLVPAQQVERV